MAFPKIAATSPILGAYHPILPDAKNAPARYLHAQFLVDHMAGGRHRAMDYLLAGEIGAFIGTGAARLIKLANKNLRPRVVEVFENRKTATTEWDCTYNAATGFWEYYATAIVAGNAIPGWASNAAGGQLVWEPTTENLVVVGWHGKFVEEHEAIDGARTMPLRADCLYRFAGYVMNNGTDHPVLLTAYITTSAGEVTKGITLPGAPNQWIPFSFTAYNYDDFAGGNYGFRCAAIPNGYLEVASVTLAEYTGALLRLESQPSGECLVRSSGNPISGGAGIGNFKVGQFALGAGHCVNTPDAPNYYLVSGADTQAEFTGDPNAGTDPTWVTHGEVMLGGETGAESPNRVETHIETAFLHEHAESGAHAPDPFAGWPRLETGTFQATAGTSTTVHLTNTALTIKELCWFAPTYPLCTATATMAAGAYKQEDTASLITGSAVAIATPGEFTIPTIAGRDYYWYVIGS